MTMEQPRKTSLPKQKQPSIPLPVQEFVAGTFGGWAQVVVGHPFDTIKVRIQTQPNPPIYRGALDCLRQTVQREGVFGLYKGVTSPLMGIGFCNAVVFAANGRFKQLIATTKDIELDNLSLIDKAAAGGLAGVAMAFLNCPVELLKVKLQTQTSGVPQMYTGVFDAGIKTFRSHGLGGLFRGLPITIMRDFPAFFAYFGSYEYLKHFAAEHNSTGKASPMQLFLAGGTAGILAWVISYPQDVIKSRMQFSYNSRTLKDAAAVLAAEAKAAPTKTQGYKVYFKGFAPTILRAFPANAATFLAYEFITDLIKEY